MDYSLSYSMITGRSVRRVATAQMAIAAHRGLLLAGAGDIVVRNGIGTVVTLASLVANVWPKRP